MRRSLLITLICAVAMVGLQFGLQVATGRSATERIESVVRTLLVRNAEPFAGDSFKFYAFPPLDMSHTPVRVSRDYDIYTPVLHGRKVVEVRFRPGNPPPVSDVMPGGTIDGSPEVVDVIVAARAAKMLPNLELSGAYTQDDGEYAIFHDGDVVHYVIPASPKARRFFPESMLDGQPIPIDDAVFIIASAHAGQASQ